MAISDPLIEFPPLIDVHIYVLSKRVKPMARSRIKASHQLVHDYSKLSLHKPFFDKIQNYLAPKACINTIREYYCKPKLVKFIDTPRHSHITPNNCTNFTNSFIYSSLPFSPTLIINMDLTSGESMHDNKLNM